MTIASKDFASLSILAVLTCACAGPHAVPRPSDQPKITQWKPGDELQRPDAALSFTFDRAMTNIEAVGPVLEKPPVALTPELPLRVYWQDVKTLIVQPETTWKSGTRYQIRLLDPAFANLEAPREFTVDATPLRLQYVALPPINVPTKPAFIAVFNLPVRPEQAAEHCILRSKLGSTQLTAAAAAPDSDGTPADPTRIRFEARTELPRLTRFKLDCPGLLPAGGDAPFRANAADSDYQIHGPLALDRAWPAQNSALPPEHAELCLELSTPVEDEELGRHVHVDPAPEGLERGWYEGRCDPERDPENRFGPDRANSILLAPRRRYTVTLDPELRDVFGQTLGTAARFEFATTDRIPGLWTATGPIAVLELGRKEHALGALNLATAELDCASLAPEQFASLYDGITNWIYQAHYDAAEEERAPAPWRALGIAPRTQRLDARAQPNTARTVPLDLGAICSGEATRAGKSGVYAFELVGNPSAPTKYGQQGDGPARLVANLTDLAVIAKRGDTSAIAWVTRLSTGALVPNAAAELWSASGQLLARAQTDERGLARFAKLPEAVGGELFSVRAGDDLAVVGTDSYYRDGLQAWQLGVREGYDGAIRLFVHTDRGVYRPGERVYVHGLARRLRDGAKARVPSERAVKIELRAENDLLYQAQLQLNDFGSFAVEIDLPKHVPPGSHSLTVEVAGKTEYQTVTVADFKPLTFELAGGPVRAEVLAGEAIELDVVARYLFGTPLSAAETQLIVERAAGSIQAPEFPEYRFEDDAPALPKEEPWPAPQEGVALEQAAKTDAAGRVHFAFNAEASRRPTRYQIQVAATDAAKDRATRNFSVLAHSAERYPGVKLSRFVLGADDPIEADVVLVDRAGKPLAGEADVEVRHELWDCKDPTVRCGVSVRVLEHQHVSVGADKPARVTFAAAHAHGAIHIRATTADAAGRQARASDSAYLWSNEGAGAYNDRIAATLSADQRRYAIGATARLALQTPLALENVLVTSERADLFTSEVMPRSAGIPSVMLDARTAPNVFVTVSGMTPRTAAGEAGRPRLTMGARELTVEGPSRVLTTKIVLARDAYEPRQRVEGDILVSHLGKALPAEVALVVVNESVLQLTGFETPDPVRVFHAPRGLSVLTASNIPLVIADPLLAAKVPETARVGTPGEDGGGGKPELRNDYVAAAYVAPQLRTDARGKAHFAFDAPTDLSAYRLMVIAAAKDDRVGSSDTRITVAQPLSAHMIAPRFVSRGDTLQLGARVHDSTGQPGPTDVRFTAEGLALQQSAAQLTADVAGTLIKTTAQVQDVDHAAFEVELHKGVAADRIRHELEVRRPLDRELRVLGVERAPKTHAALSWPAGIDPELSRLEITVDRAGLAPLAPVLAMVVDYPYGCTEQTAAALSALAATPELARAILPGLAIPARFDARIQDGIGRLLQARAPEGGFALYPGMSARSWLTALVLEAGLAVRAAGWNAPDAITSNAAEQLQQWLGAQNLLRLAAADLERAAHALLLVVRSGLPPGAAIEALFSQRERMTVSGRAYLLHASALANLPDDKRAPLRAALSRADWLQQVRDLDQPFASAERTTAVALLALEAERAASGPVRADDGRERLARWLIARATDPEVFLSTRDAADVLTALATWARGAQVGAGQVRIGLGKDVLWQGPLAGAQVVAIDRSAKTSPADDVWIEADGDVSASIRRRDVSPTAPKPAFARGLSLERRYSDPKTAKPLTSLALGDVVQVELELRSERALRMVALEEPLPGGLEPLDPGLSSGSVAGCDRCNELGGFDHLRRRDDRVEGFAEWLPAGSHKLRYLLRATTAGSFSAPGAAATLMYAPNVFARSTVGRIVVKP
ncbi:MAG TPA: MG2 domain-containing protein [Polyangiales bacterium]|nr:MG2 domain-containing protein [Polyangiales bacterium]